ncbi:DUF805 domain-containing protein [Acinetobacter tibetensis]|uniref:DUF805 domain-containing protein n=1 Tax=Acinetobacter tibetensis TaxID=2943497 RepID=UPI003A4D458D
MKGTLVDFNFQINEGVIQGDDGKRYSFFGSEWKDHTSPARGQNVDFAVNDLNQAVSIYVQAFARQPVFKKTNNQHTEQLQAEENFGLFDWTMKCLKNYANFSGRARRKEYWYFYLFQILIGLLIGLSLGIMGMSDNGIDAISGLLSLFFLLPTLAVGVRRLHDVNRSGWWMLLMFTIIGLIPLLIWAVSETKPESNQWGEPAK